MMVRKHARPCCHAFATLAVLLAACGGGGGDGGGEAGIRRDFETPRSAAPGELVGNWLWGSISPTNFWDDHTGTYEGSAYGMSDYYTFTEDGFFQEYVYIFTQDFGCKTQVWTRMEGTVVFDGDTFTKYAGAGHYQAEDTCVASFNFERDMTAEEVAAQQGKVYDWRFEPDPNTGETQLHIGPGGSGETVVYEPR